MDAVIGVDADEVCIEGSMMDLGEWQAIGDQRLTQKFVAIGDNMSRVEQTPFG